MLLPRLAYVGIVSSCFPSGPAFRTKQVGEVEFELLDGNLAKGLGLGGNTFQVRVLREFKDQTSPVDPSEKDPCILVFDI